jgi:hypothetical protein
MAQFLCRRFGEYGWLEQDQTAEVPVSLGIVMRVKNGDDTEFILEPPTMDANIKIICFKLNLAVVFTMSSEITNLVFARIAKNDSEITLWPNNITIPIIDSLQVFANHGGGTMGRDFCYLIRKEKIVLVWGDSAEEMIVRGEDVESKLRSSVRPSSLRILCEI